MKVIGTKRCIPFLFSIEEFFKIPLYEPVQIFHRTCQKKTTCLRRQKEWSHPIATRSANITPAAARYHPATNRPQPQTVGTSGRRRGVHAIAAVCCSPARPLSSLALTGPTPLSSPSPHPHAPFPADTARAPLQRSPTRHMRLGGPTSSVEWFTRGPGSPRAE